MSWYYAVNGQQAGPVGDPELQRLVAVGTVNAATFVWRQGMEAWAPFGTIAACSHCLRSFFKDQVIPLAGGHFCAECKSVLLQRIREGLSPLTASKPYAGFWIRAIARMIDNTITSIAAYIFQIPLLIVIATMGRQGQPNISAVLGTAAIAVVLSLAAAAYYEAWFLVNKGATPGKMILGLKVIRARGGKFTWSLAIGRYFAYTMSGLLLYFGYIMAAWDEEKRSLHDRICDTRVVTGG